MVAHGWGGGNTGQLCHLQTLLLQTIILWECSYGLD